MKEKLQNDQNTPETDPVWKLLDKISKSSRVEVSPWFSAQTTAKAVEIPQSRWIISFSPILRRFLLPIPLAVTAALLLLTLHTGHQTGNSNPFVSSEDEFEQHMAMLVSTD